MTAPRVSAIVLAYREEPWLERCVDALLDSRGVDVDVVLVDNGSTDGGVDRMRAKPGVHIVGSGENLGFSGGCNLGVAASSGAYVALVNGDLIVEPDALAQLVAVAAEPDVGIAAGSVRLADDPDLLNTAGNEIHFLGFSWVGGFGEPAAVAARDRDVAGAMGALAVMRRDAWDALGGFAPEYFAFHEDAELSWRCWQRGWRVHYVAGAIGLHRYEFGREPRKLYLAERNRWIFVLTCWGARTLLLLAPALLAVEGAVVAASMRGGWWRDKVAGWRWCWNHRRWLRERRATVQAARTVSDRRLASLMTERLDARNFPIPDALRPLDSLLAAYWRVVRGLLR